MKRQGFTEAELSKLAQAKANSDGLVRTETVAMNMVKGQYDDGNGGFTRQAPPDLEHARAMMHDLAYHQNKAKIMKPVDEFLAMLDRRTADEVSSAQVAQSRWSSVAVALASVLACLVVLCLTTLRRRTIVVFEEVGTAADAMARGDLCFVLARDRSGDEGRLRTALEAMRVRLCDLVGAIRAGAVSVASASDEIAQGNADLSQRTEEQAGNLQQTAASMLHLSGAVKNAADSASLADQLARNAASTAARGGQMVGDVVDTMQHISTSSRKIADIIGVVDGIAFQTNLLALNAAVEAARAGEQGRGFAVVAGEVRNLAGRSAAAAKEIKSLISLSVSRVELGTQQVDAAGAAMREIVTEVQRVSEMIEGLSRAGKEQAVGIGQIDDAVQELDRVTQQNASLVEESAAAAESLQNQAATLAEAVSVFRVNDDAALSPLGAPHLA
jgi:methyl-accepting chemotaxis protein